VSTRDHEKTGFLVEKTRISVVGSVLAAIAASFCCIGPIVVVLLGVGSIGAFAAFEAYRPYLIAVTTILLSTSFYLTYRKQEVKCEDGTCRVAGGGRWNKATLWLATLLAAIAIAFPYLDVVQTQAAETPAGTNASVVLHIDGMDCSACAKGLEATLGRIAGVQNATVKYTDESAIILYNPMQVQPERFVELVDETGYKATIETEGKKVE